MLRFFEWSFFETRPQPGQHVPSFGAKSQEIALPGSWIFKIFQRSISPDPDSGFKGAGGLCAPFLDSFLFYRNEVYEQKISIKLVRNLSQNTGNGHLETQIVGGACPQTPLENARFGLSLCPPLKVLHPLEISHAKQFLNLGISADRTVRTLIWRQTCSLKTQEISLLAYSGS